MKKIKNAIMAIAILAITVPAVLIVVASNKVQLLKGNSKGL